MRRSCARCSPPTPSPGPRIEKKAAPDPELAVAPPTDPGSAALDAETGEPEAITLEDLERRHIERLLGHHRNVTRVAEILDINRRTLQRKLRAWGIDVDES